MISIVVPVYKNAENIPALIPALERLSHSLTSTLEVVFVVDGSPDNSLLQLTQALPNATFASQLASLSRNFGAFAAIRAGLAIASGEYIAVMAADLQEPPSLILEFERVLLAGGHDIVVGKRVARQDPTLSKLSSHIFWWFYRRFIQPEIPDGGVDIFACTKTIRDQLLLLPENNSSLIGLLFWVGFRRAVIPYERQTRVAGISAWTFRKKLRYLVDSVFSFSDLPIRVLLNVGLLGLLTSVALATAVTATRLFGSTVVPGYAATVLLIVFFGALNCFGLGLIGGYVWRTFENTKGRPLHVIASHLKFAGQNEPAKERKIG